jgi:hypothetical protein
MKIFSCTLALLIFSALASMAQPTKAVTIPDVYSNIHLDDDGRLYLQKGDEKIYERLVPQLYSLAGFTNGITGTANGLSFDFSHENLNGIMYYGFIPYGDSKHPTPVYFRRVASIEKGKASINIKDAMKGTYDMIGWETTGRGTIGYRIITDKGQMIYDGKITFKGTGPFEVDHSILEGPLVNLLNESGATISLVTNNPVVAHVRIAGQTFSSPAPATHHEITVTGLAPNTTYPYQVSLGSADGPSVGFSLKTAPPVGAKTAFTFAYASDSRNSNGGGERDMYGVNFYIMRKIMALNAMKNVAFFQFTGDMINGYLTSKDETDLQYANWKRALEPYWHYFPVYLTMGNHEALVRVFNNTDRGYGTTVDRFPFATESAEAVFAQNFTLPTNGPESEDGSNYDPNPKAIDFPSYRENAYSYTYCNVAMVVLNSNYFYAPSTEDLPTTSGGLHAYIMDKQLEWFEATIAQLEKDKRIDHIFVTSHTPCFPNGGHVKDDMWYGGDNSFRSWVNGKPLEKGIIERRDDLLDIMVNKSKKVRALLTGDEHNYAKTAIEEGMARYPEGWDGKRVTLSRKIYQVNNGAAGAPYYAQEQTPWSPQVSGFTTQNALVFFHVKGKKIQMEVLNPDTLETVDTLSFP